MSDILFTKKLFGSLPSGGSGSPSSYTSLTSKPQINGVTLTGNKTTADLNIPSNYTLSGLNITSTGVTSKALVQAVVAKNLPSGAFVTGGVSLTDFPSQSLSNAEIQISIKDSTLAGVKVYDMTLSSVNVSPYVWYAAYRTDQTSAPVTWVTVEEGANKDLSNLSATGEAHFLKSANLKTINNNSLIGSGDISIKTYSDFPNDFVTSGTLQQVANSMVDSSGSQAGKAYLGGISGACMPWPGGGNAECKVEFMSDGLAVLSLSSADVAPYKWEYNTASGDYKWRKSLAQMEVMPTSNLDLAVGVVVQYVGTTDANYTNGYFYKCVENSGSYSWQRYDVQPQQQTFQVATLPTANLAEYTNRNIYEYKGDSVEGGYIFGYFYHCAGGPESLTATQTVGTSVGTITTDKDEFKVAVGAGLTSGDYTFVATGTVGQPATGWTLNSTAISSIADYGIYFSGIAVTGTTIKATYTAESYSWEQLNVQPGGGSSRTTVTDTTSTTASLSVNAGTDYIYTQSLTSLSITGTSGNMMNEATITFTTGNNPSVNVDQSITRMGGPVTFESHKTYIISFWNGFYIVGVEG